MRKTLTRTLIRLLALAIGLTALWVFVPATCILPAQAALSGEALAEHSEYIGDAAAADVCQRRAPAKILSAEAQTYWFTPALRFWEAHRGLIIVCGALAIAAILIVPVSVTALVCAAANGIRRHRAARLARKQQKANALPFSVCPGCGAAILDDAKFCFHCGRQIKG